MTDNLTSDMHAEFKVDPATELKHKASCVIQLIGSHYSQEELETYSALYGISPEQVLKYI